RQRPHSPPIRAIAAPDTSTPSMTASRRNSSEIGNPGGTNAKPTASASGAGADNVSRRIEPGRRPSSRVSITSGARASRCGADGWAHMAVMGIGFAGLTDDVLADDVLADDVLADGALAGLDLA